MLTRVDIANYRGFEAYQARDLAQVNLFVGKNNSGKTALLEGIQFLTSGGDPSVFVDAAQRRGELVVLRPEPSYFLVDFAHFFHGHTMPIKSSMTFRGDNGHQPISVRVFPQKNDSDQPKRPPGYFVKIAGQFKSDWDGKYPISREGGVDFDVRPSRFGRTAAARRGNGPPVRFIGPDSLGSIELAAMWDDVTPVRHGICAS